MNDTAQTAAAAGLSLAVIAFCLLIGLALYIFTCFCFKRICEKCKVDPGIMMWVKICSARGKSPWLVIMAFIPILNIAFIPYLAFSE